MSHYRVLVITTNNDAGTLEGMLAPYDENDHLTEWVADDDSDGGGYHRNPNAKWDWWVVGGRWPNRLATIDGTFTNSCRRSDLDIPRMMDLAEAEFQKHWDAVEALIGDLPPARLWSEIREMYPGNIEFARLAWREQPRVAALSKSEYHWDQAQWIVDHQVTGHAACRDRRRRLAVTGCSLLAPEIGWIEEGEMGWFGMSTATDESTDAYQAKALSVIENMPPNWWLTSVDCHI